MRIRRTMLGVFAHPDDETFAVGGLFALAAQQGGKAYIISATRGERGKKHVGDDISTDELADMRTEELRKAASLIGVEDLWVWNYGDGRLDEADREDVSSRIADIIEKYNIDMVITFAPDGATGHRDHIAIHEMATIAFRKSTAEELYWRVLPAGLRDRFAEAIRGRPRTHGHYRENEAPYVDEKDVVAMDVSGVIEQKNAAAQAHESQNFSMFEKLPAELRKDVWETEYFYCAEKKPSK